ncbi:hypothetical protein PPYR_05708 [Photinus pyralis]|uniref:Peptidase S1 domain-containing protein n=1 Tax=Photinus pyralis TaxID=7054 RepID=A0A5N4AVJ1_PHOPY|nr:hypothetical protein PPYR_05708 [Photinus pyralis]
MPKGTFENGRVIGGSPAPDNAYPYHIAIWRRDWSLKWVYHCGGSIINERHVLTAAHCVSGGQDAANFRIVAGNHKLSDVQQAVYAVSEIIIHEDFERFALNDDIAILKLNEAITYGVRIQPVGLAEVYPPPGTNCTVTGWGLVGYPSYNTPDELQYIQLKTISLDECKARLAPVGVAVSDEQICTLTKAGEGVCKGDSGGPLVDNASGKQIGVVSWGPYTCASGYSDVYTNVYAYRSWIGQHSG